MENDFRQASAMPAEYKIIHHAMDRRVHRYEISCEHRCISYGDALELWQRDEEFVACFVASLVESPFSAFRWETPPISQGSIDRPFEYVLLDSPGLEQVPDEQTYADYFSQDKSREGIVEFENLGKDALLVAPSPRSADADYAHLAGFVRSAPEAQSLALWSVVGAAAQQRLSEQRMWINTAGGGVFWLHVRLDSTPKYYGYDAYSLDA